jgi:multidrug resistance efflux pump
VGGRGIVEALGENVRIAAPVSALVTDVLASVGQEVTTGAPLLQLDARTAEADVRVAQAQIAVLEGRLKEAEAQLADRVDVFRRTKTISDNQILSKNEGERDRFAVLQAEAAVVRTKSELESSRESHNRAKTALDLLTIRAPREGTILQINVRAGEYASQLATDPLLLLGQTRGLQLRVDVDEENASRIRPGTEAVAYPKGMPDYPVALVFDRIEPYIVPKRSLTGQSTERVDTRVLQVIYTFAPGRLPVYVGQQMDVFLKAREDDPAHQAKGGK